MPYDRNRDRNQTLKTSARQERRALLVSSASLMAWWVACKAGAAEGSASKAEAEVSIVPVSDAGVPQPAVKLPKIVKTDAEWRKQLSAISFSVTRKEDTETPFTGATWNNHEKGLYRCICCDTALFNSATKFESGTGWPSFWQPIAKENITEITDHTFGMLRTAVACKRCDAHLGHVFDDGPKPTGLRYCMNSASLRFVKFA
jgi:peptide-methionine (R)-S-oxide reductase